MDDEKQLIHLSKNGDRKSFDMLVKKYASQIFNLAYRLSGNRDTAQDIAQESFINAYIGIKNFEERSSFLSWLYRITINCWKNKVRYEKRRFFSRHVSIDEMIETEDTPIKRDVISKEEDVVNKVETKIRSEEVQKILDTLDYESKTIIILRDIFEKEYEEISDIMKIPLGTVKSRLSRARQELRQKISFLIDGEKK
ncbi:MAG: sigma-70 family RNA polymerase sigma factor [Candidatus Goldbacteria bacterium]|nr:sigma-70 family RNA polymerase sigma factor [Candidatus Goldiibacteriota bacterium]